MSDAQKDKAKVAVVIDSIKQGGGAEKNAVRLIEQLEQAGYESLLCTFHSYDTEYRYSGQRVSFLEKPQSFFIYKIAKYIKRLFLLHKLYQQEKVTHVVSFLESANTATTLTKLFFRPRNKLILSVRADPRFVTFFKQHLIRFLYKRADIIVSVSKQMQQTLEEDFKLGNVVTIQNPIDTDFVHKEMQKPLPEAYKFLQNIPTGTIFVNVGRLTGQKNQALLINSFASVASIHKDIYLIIIGEGPKRPELEALIKKHGLENRIFLVGQQENIYPFLKIADCFVLTSLYEGFPNVLLEAAAADLYIISIDCQTGPREIVAPDTLEQEIKYPYRVEGASLFVGTNQQKEVTALMLTEELQYFVEQNKCLSLHSISITNYNFQNYKKKWLQLVI